MMYIYKEKFEQWFLSYNIFHLHLSTISFSVKLLNSNVMFDVFEINLPKYINIPSKCETFGFATRILIFKSSSPLS